MSNRKGLFRGLANVWFVLALLKSLSRKGGERLLGRLDWAPQPSAGLSPNGGCLLLETFWRLQGACCSVEAFADDDLLCFYTIALWCSFEDTGAPACCLSPSIIFTDTAPLFDDMFSVNSGFRIN